MPCDPTLTHPKVLFLDLYHMGNWSQNSVNTSCEDLIECLPVYLRSARSNSTTKIYSCLFSAFLSWCRSFILLPLPADPLTVALFLIDKHKSNVSTQTIISYFCAIKWAHELANKQDPTTHFLVKQVVEACKRMPKVKQSCRQPLPFSTLVKICKKADDNSLASLRTACLFSLAFHGFLRSQEVLGIKKDINFKKNSSTEFVELKIESSKTDQYKRGNKIILSVRQDPSCPVKLTKTYLQKADLLKTKNNAQKIFCNLNPYSDKLDLSKPLSYGRLREIFRGALNSLSSGQSAVIHCG